MRAGIVEREDPGVEGEMSLLHAHFLHPQIYFGKQREEGRQEERSMGQGHDKACFIFLFY